jgi:hypothetical protein
MAGFKAAEAVEELAYDFRPYDDTHGVIPEPSSKQIEKFQKVVFGTVRNLGLTPEDMTGETKVTFDLIESVMDKSHEVERDILVAVGELTGIEAGTIEGLPHRVKSAFMGWIMGEFLSPEGSAPATR